MSYRFDFNPDVLKTVAGGRSVLDMPRLHIHSDESAKSFIESYGFRLEDEQSVKKLFYFHRRALVLMTEKLGFSIQEIPAEIRDPKKLEDLLGLLKMASQSRGTDATQAVSSAQPMTLQKWACALLRCMHVFVHAESDLFSAFSYEIQKQILTPFEKSVRTESGTTYLFSPSDEKQKVDLLAFEVKPFKTSTSAVIKLLAKPDAVAMRIYDKVGVRFVTKGLFDSFQVIRFIVEQNLMSFPHIMPDQSSNNLYPVDIFLKVCQKAIGHQKQIQRDLTPIELEKMFEDEVGGAEILRKHNDQSSKNFKFIKFITRRLVHIRPDGKDQFSFFYPYEIQIMDQKAHEDSQMGPTVHDAYKERQKEAARQRLFPSEYAP